VDISDDVALVDILKDTLLDAVVVTLLIIVDDKVELMIIEADAPDVPDMRWRLTPMSSSHSIA
jgi:hypothetical protein